MNPDTLRMLRERVAGLQGPDRDVDVELWRVLERKVAAKDYAGDQTYGPAFTASIDAAIGLVERCLPGWWWQLRKHPPPQGFYFGLSRYRQDVPPEEAGYDIWIDGDEMPTAPLAVLIAVLNALIRLEK